MAINRIVSSKPHWIVFAPNRLSSNRSILGYSEMELKCVFFAELDNKLGPKVTFQYPDGYLDPKEFDMMSDYIVTDEDLCHRFVHLSALEKVFVGFPVRMESKKYHRNFLLFNLGLVLDQGADASKYEPLIRKLARIIKVLELESEFIFHQGKKQRLKSIVQAMFLKLTTEGEASIWFDPSNRITLKLFSTSSIPPNIEEFDVPVKIKDFQLMPVGFWDLTMQQVIPFVDGHRHVREIAEQSSVDVELVMECIRQLIYFGCIAIVDIFQFCNVYRVDDPERLDLLISSEEFRDLAVSCISLRKDVDKCALLELVFGFYCRFSKGVSVENLVNANHSLIELFSIDPRELVQFATLNKILKRVHVYPMLLSNEVKERHTRTSMSFTPFDVTTRLMPNEQMLNVALLDGKHCLDKICCVTQKSQKEVMHLLSTFKHCLMLNR